MFTPKYSVLGATCECGVTSDMDQLCSDFAQLSQFVVALLVGTAVYSARCARRRLTVAMMRRGSSVEFWRIRR